MKTLEVGKSYPIAGNYRVEIKIINKIGEVFVGERNGDVNPYNARGEYLRWDTLQPVNPNKPVFFDLALPKEKLVRWVNVYGGYGGCPGCEHPAVGHLTQEEADRYGSPTRLACVRIECEEGEGL